MEVLNDAERRFSAKLVAAMLPELVDTFWAIWEETKKETKDRKFVENYRQNLRKIKDEWSNVKVKGHVANIVKECAMFPRLIAAVFVIHVKILSSIRIDKNSKKISLKLPSNDVFVHTCFIECARDLYEEPWIITDEKPVSERRDELNRRFTKCIRETIENLVPTEEILNAYLTLPDEETSELEMGEDLAEPGPEPEPEPEFGEEEGPPNLEQALDAAETASTPALPDITETPGGTKTVTVTPVSAAPHREELFPDAPETGKKDV